MKLSDQVSLVKIWVCVLYCTICFASTAPAQSAGFVDFAARIAGVYDAPVLVCEGGLLNRASGTNYLVQLYAFFR